MKLSVLPTSRPSTTPRSMRTRAAAQTIVSKKIPSSCTNVTVELRGSNGHVCYLLGVSHVSRVDLDRIRDFIAATKPEAVMVELCKDRTDLLLDPQIQPNNPSQRWYLSGVSILGLPSTDGFPTQQQLLNFAGIASNIPLSKSDMESGAVSLLSTGLFKSVSITCSQAPLGTAPMLLPKGGPFPSNSNSNTRQGQTGESSSSNKVPGPNGELGSIEAVLPLGVLSYATVPRTVALPTALRFEGPGAPSGEAAESLAASTLQRCKAGGAIAGLLWLRSQLLSQGAKSVTFTGLDSPSIIVTLAPTPASAAEVSGFESSAVNGRGSGIDNAYTVGPRAPFSTQAPALNAEGFTLQGPRPDAGTMAPPPQANPLAVALARAITGPYSVSQALAGRKAGVQAGAAWRVSVEAAMAAGSRAIYLGDRPVDVTKVRLANGVFGAMTGRWAVGMAAVGAGVGAALSGSLPEGTELAAIGAGLAAFAALGALPLLAPLNEVKAFAAKTGKEIEDIVRIETPLGQDLDSPVQVWGEDALLNWPGAVQPVIAERDRYMAYVLRNAVEGTGTHGAAVPAFLRLSDGSFKYAAAARGPKGANLLGGSVPPSYEQTEGVRSLVAVVGTAHVKGIVKAWGGGVSSSEFESLV